MVEKFRKKLELLRILSAFDYITADKSLVVFCGFSTVKFDIRRPLTVVIVFDRFGSTSVLGLRLMLVRLL